MGDTDTHHNCVDFTSNVSGGGMNCVSCDTCVYHLGLFVFFPWGIPQRQSDWSLSCDHGLDYASLCENNNASAF